MLKLSIGRQSNGELVEVDLKLCQNLFVSYFKTEQVDSILQSILPYINDPLGHHFYLASDSRMKNYFTPDGRSNNEIQTYYFDKPFRSTLRNKSDFINAVYKIYNSNKKKININKQISTIVIIDNIWNIIQNISKSSGTKLIELLSKGHIFQIHFIITSPSSYYNLFNQILKAGSEEISTNNGRLPIGNDISKVGSEIIYNSDELIFFKPHNSMELIRLFKI